jgi:hypothetical protein
LVCRSFHDNDHKLGLSSRDFSGSWSESPLESHYGDFKEEKKKQSDYFRDERRETVRHPVPGPITREKLEAAELRSESKRNLTQLKRSTSGGGLSVGIDKKVDNKKSENQVSKSYKSNGFLFLAKFHVTVSEGYYVTKLTLWRWQYISGALFILWVCFMGSNFLIQTC